MSYQTDADLVSTSLFVCFRLGITVALGPLGPRTRNSRGIWEDRVMRVQPLVARQRDRIAAGLPFVESLARRVAASMPHSIELCDLVQDGMLGLIDAACRFDEARGIKFETFAERRVRGAMIDALRKDAWPRGVRRQRRELEAAREELRRELGAEPTLADLAARVGSDEARLGRTILRINTIESTSPLSAGEHPVLTSLPAALVPSEPQSPDKAFEEREVRGRIRAAIASLPPRERKVIGLYYYNEATMKQIGEAIGVNESRVSQLHARAIQRLRKALGADAPADTIVTAILSFQNMAERQRAARTQPSGERGVVLPYKAPVRPNAVARRAAIKPERAVASAR
jgi:RNA polymerase sigma factor FliA